MTGIEVGLGAAEVIPLRGTGVVVWGRRDSAWLRLPGGICGVAEASAAPPGPLWLRGPFPWGEVTEGEVARVTVEGIEIAGTILPLRRAAVWRGPLPAPDLVESGRPAALTALAGARPSSLHEPPMSAAGRRAEEAAAAGDLGGAAAALGGLGPGLTPAGDDVLCGILVAARARWGEPSEPGLVAVATGVATTELAAGFLRWAARGQHIAPVHDLLRAAATPDPIAARAAVERLSTFGSSSGADVAYGLRLGLTMPFG